MEETIELYVLDESYQILDLIDGFIALIWNPKYYGVGGFELHCGVKYAALLQQGYCIDRKDAEDTGIIEEISYANDPVRGKKVVVKGRFLKAMLEDRAVDVTRSFYNVAAGSAIMQLVNTFCIAPANSDRKVPKLQLAEGNSIGGTITTQITGGSLLDAIDTICEEQEISCNIVYDFLNDKLTFRVWQGVDRTQNQTENEFATFSEEFDNISNVSYSKNKRHRNIAYVAGAGEGNARIVEVVDIRKAGEARRELYVDARDLQQKDKDGNLMTETAYRQTLRQRGLEKLKDYQVKETIDTKVDQNSGFVYGEDYALGDIVTFMDATTGLMAEQRVTEIYEYIEKGEYRVDAVFGQSKLTIMEKMKRGVL